MYIGDSFLATRVAKCCPWAKQSKQSINADLASFRGGKDYFTQKVSRTTIIAHTINRNNKPLLAEFFYMFLPTTG